MMRMFYKMLTSMTARMNDFFKPIPKTEAELERLKKKNEQKTAEKKRKQKLNQASKKNAKKPKLGS